MDGHYSVLNNESREIRLLTIPPSPIPDRVVKCSLQTMSLNDAPKFAALSYVWGDTTVMDSVMINGVSISVTTNLVAALRALEACRSKEEDNPIQKLPIFLWVDAICINQQDVIERSSQVQLMRDIYRNADKVISWLGPEADGSAEIISVLRSMAFEIKHLGEEDNRFEWVQRYPHLVEDCYFTEEAISRASVRFRNLAALWRRDYWKRTWIFQEIVLARDVLILCGKECIPWTDLTAVDKWLTFVKTTSEQPPFVWNFLWPFFAQFLNILPRPVGEIEMLRNLWHTPNSESEIKKAGLRVLRRNTILHATDPRDKIYGLLGLINFDIAPDYSKSIRAVFTEASIKHLECYGLGETLNQAGIGHGHALDLPSWVPNWNDLPNYWRQASGILMATTIGTNFILNQSNPDILKVLVFQLGRITDLEPVDFSDSGFESLAARLLELCHNALARYGDCPYPTGIPVLQAILRLVLESRDLISHPEPGPEVGMEQIEIPSKAFFDLALAFEFAICSAGTPIPVSVDERYAHNEDFKENLQKLGLHLDDSFPRSFSRLFMGNDGLEAFFKNDGEQIKFSTAAQTDINQGMIHNLTGMKVFYVENKYIGIGPPAIRPGDLVCAIAGCPFPVLLRRDTKGYRYVGRCCVEGWKQFVEELRDVVSPREVELY